MKSLFFTLLLLLCVATCFSQNYQCVQPGVKRYFTHLSSGHLRGMRVDSVTTDNGDSVFHLFRTPRGPYVPFAMSQLDTNGGSWLGKTIIQNQDGTTFIPTFWGDTCVIRTQAQTGQTWIFYNDSSANYYKATVMSVDTMTVLGLPDSIKRIKIRAYNTSGINPADTLHGKYLIISKEHGIVQTIPLYMFPFHDQVSSGSSGQDYLLDHSLDRYGPIYQLTDPEIPDGLDFYNFNVGDVFEYSHYFAISNMPYGKSLDSIISKTIVSPVQVNYTGHRFTANYIVMPQSHFEYADSIFSFEAHAGPIFTVPALMPEESGSDFSFYFSPSDSTYCLKSFVYGYGTNNSILPDGVVNDLPCGNYYRFKEGFGLVNYGECIDPGITGKSSDLIYSVKNGVACGSYQNVLGVDEVNTGTNIIQLSPVPANDILNISVRTPCQFTLFNLLGNVVRTAVSFKQAAAMDVSDLPDGVYFLRATNREGSSSATQKILIRH